MDVGALRGQPVSPEFDHLLDLDLEDFPKGKLSRARISMCENGLGQPILMPLMVARGHKPGPVVGLTAAMHGNELNGVRVIQALLKSIDVHTMAGTVIAVPVVNVPGFLMNRREFNDGADLNRIMPGQASGDSSQIYAHRLLERVVRKFDYLIDLHTASFGRANTLYVRADLSHADAYWMAMAQQPQIILHNTGADGTLRAAAMGLGIPSITVEVGDPQLFQVDMIRAGLRGVSNVLARLNMVPEASQEDVPPPVICSRAYWVHTDHGGLLEVFVELGEQVSAGQCLAQVNNVFGDVLAKYHAVEDAIVIGRSTNPVNQTGARIVYLGSREDTDALHEPPIRIAH